MNQNYTTQMDAARKGIITEQMKIVAEKEYMPVEQLRQLVAHLNGNILYQVFCGVMVNRWSSCGSWWQRAK